MPPPPDPRKIYFGGLPIRYPEDEVKKLAEEAGKVRGVAVRNDEIGRRTYAFVEYEEERDAEEALKRLNGKEVDGQRITVEVYRGGRREGGGGDRGDRRGPRGRGAGPSKTLFVGNLHEEVSDRELRDEFERYGGINDIRLGSRRAKDGRQHAFVEFNDVRSAEDAFDRLKNGRIRGLPIRLDFDAGFQSGGERGGGGPDRGGDRRGGGDRFAPYPRAGGFGGGYGGGRRRSPTPDRYRRYSRSPDRRYRDRSPDRRYRDRSPDRRDRSPDRRDRSPDRRDRSPDRRDRSPDRRDRDRSPPRRDRSRSPRDRSPPRRRRSGSR